MIRGKPAPPKKLGTVQTIDMNTGAVLRAEANACTLLPPAPDVCQECAVDHAHDQPHNAQSLYYQQRFYATHGRYPTWSDALAHCTPEVQALCRRELAKVHAAHGLPLPDDLKDPKHPPIPGR